jgi:CheY-like chemotaxis protein
MRAWNMGKSAVKCVLHVDDDESILLLIDRVLTRRGYQVVSLSDPRQALDKLAECGARVVLLDIDMPHIDGLSLLQDIKRRDAGVQVLMVTGMVSMGTVLRATSMGAEGCIFKPLNDLQQVVDGVDRAFAKIQNWWDTLHHWIQRNPLAAKRMEVVLDEGLVPPASQLPASQLPAPQLPVPPRMPSPSAVAGSDSLALPPDVATAGLDAAPPGVAPALGVLPPALNAQP